MFATGLKPQTPAWESNVTTTAPEHYVLKNESSFYIITQLLVKFEWETCRQIIALRRL